MGVSLERVQFKFASIVGELCSEPDVLSQFAVWLDLRLAEYKLKGAISLDCSGEEPDPIWLKGLNKQKKDSVNSQTDRQTYSHSPAFRRSSSQHRSAPQTPQALSDSPLPHSQTVPNMDLHVEHRLSPDVVVVKEEPEDVFPVSLHENSGSVPVSGHKRTAVEASLGSHWSTSSSPSATKFKRMSSKESPSHQSLMTVIGDFESSDVLESDAMGDNSAIASGSSSQNMSDSAAKQTEIAADQSVDLNESSLSNDNFLQEVRWSGQQGVSSDMPGTSSNVQPSTFERALLQGDHNADCRHKMRREENMQRKLKIGTERLAILPRQSVADMMLAVGTFERWLWSSYRNETRAISDIPPTELDEFLAEFLRTVLTPSGTNYKPKSFTKMRGCIGRYLKETDYPEIIQTSRLFAKSQEAYSARKLEIMKDNPDRMQNKSCNISEDESTCIDFTSFGTEDFT